FRHSIGEYSTVSKALKSITQIIAEARKNASSIEHDAAYDAYRFYLHYSLRNEERLLALLKASVASNPDMLFEDFLAGVADFDYPDIEYGFYGLMDARLFYALYDQKKNGARNVVIAAGGAHLEAITAGLISLGYQKIKSKGMVEESSL